jgi:hypothetical protein
MRGCESRVQVLDAEPTGAHLRDNSATGRTVRGRLRSVSENQEHNLSSITTAIVRSFIIQDNKLHGD